MRPLSGSDLAELARYPASLQQTIVALCGVAPSSSEQDAVPASHPIIRHHRLAKINEGSGAYLK